MTTIAIQAQQYTILDRDKNKRNAQQKKLNKAKLMSNTIFDEYLNKNHLLVLHPDYRLMHLVLRHMGRVIHLIGSRGPGMRTNVGHGKSRDVVTGSSYF